MFERKRDPQTEPARPNVHRSPVATEPRPWEAPRASLQRGSSSRLDLSQTERNEPKDVRVTVRVTDEVIGATVSRSVNFVLQPREAVQ